MHAIAQKCRPKHQVLVLKCYPRTAKGAVDVKPNSSELSYLLYYANSRKTKNQKVGAFLEKKTASDVWRLRIGNVQVTLQILEALIEKSPKDLPLFAPSVLKVLDTILRSNDITMVESSIPTFEAFCANHQASALFADQTYLRQYEEVVEQYARLASTRGFPGKTQPSAPLAMRWRKTGLEAIKCIADSDALSSMAGRRLDVIVPMILENLWTDNENFLDVLLHRAQLEDKVQTDNLLKRRTSIATVRTADTSGDTNPIALSGSANDVDKLAEEDIGVLAMQCLKQLFVVPNRSQIYAATKVLLAFIDERLQQDEVLVRNVNGKDSGWAVKVSSLVARWAPVQDRYIVLTSTVDTMVKTQIKSDTLPKHATFLAMIGSLLRSDVNLIGLSVMDVLLNLMQHLKRLVQMPGDPHSATPDANGSYTADEKLGDGRTEVLQRIQWCMGDLATHIYYADQISDMISAILVRLRPRRNSSTTTSSPHGELTDNAQGAEDTASESLFALTVAKKTALRAVKAIIVTASAQSKTSGSLSRNRVPIEVWEGTHWLLKDADPHVRRAYADAFVTWLEKETTAKDLVAKDDGVKLSTTTSRAILGQALNQKANGGTSIRDKTLRHPRSVFLQQLHVVIYDNALQHMDHDQDIVLLHGLLTKLIYRLGVNAARWSLPMVFRLQEDIQEAETPAQKVRLGSLCHGYFWALMEKFDFDTSPVGRAIMNEISRRRSKHFWVEGITVPPPAIDTIGMPISKPVEAIEKHEVESEALLPFDDRLSLVECVCTSYEEAGVSSPSSPAASPGRSFSTPILGSTMTTLSETKRPRELPLSYREQMLSEWTRETAMMAIQEASKTASTSGSKTGTAATGRGRIVSNGAAVSAGNHENEMAPPGGYVAGAQTLRPHSQPAVGWKGGLTPRGPSGLRKSSVRSGISPAPGSLSSRNGGTPYVTTVEQMKMVLSGQLKPRDITTSMGRDDDSDESMVSYDATASEISYAQGGRAVSTPVPPRTAPAAVTAVSPGVSTVEEEAAMRPRSRSGPQNLSRKSSAASERGGPLSSHPTGEGLTNADGALHPVDDEVPPVPPIPSDLAGTATPQPRPTTASSAQGSPPQIGVPAPALKPSKQRSIKSRNGNERVISSAFTLSGGSQSSSPMDLGSLLDSIDAKAGEQGAMGKLSEPPY